MSPNTERNQHLEPTAESIKEAMKPENVLPHRDGSTSSSMVGYIVDAPEIDERSLHVGARVNDQETIKNLVENGYGVTIVSGRAIAGCVQDGCLLSFGIPDVPCRRSFYISYRKGALADEIGTLIAYVRLKYLAEAV